MRPPVPRYSTIWDVSVVLRCLLSLSPVKLLSLKILTLKTVMLIALTTGCRGNTLNKLNIDNMVKGKSSFTFYVNMKQSRQGYKTPLIKLSAYPINRGLCIYTVLSEYLRRTSALRLDSQLFLSYMKPHHKVNTSTISRWIKIVLQWSGVDISVFKSHSTRAASASKAFSQVPLDCILNTVGWSKSTTFAKYYNKKVCADEASTFSNAVLA